MLSRKKAGCGSIFSRAVREALPADLATALLHTYAISDDGEDDQSWMSILSFASDINFYAPALAFAKAWDGKAYLYHFNEVNPWDGPWKGYATHVLDVAYLFMNYSEHLSPEQSTLASKFAEDVIMFVNGQAPWPAFDSEEPVARVYSSGEADGKATSDVVPENRDVWSRLTEQVDLDALSNAWVRFMIS